MFEWVQGRWLDLHSCFRYINWFQFSWNIWLTISRAYLESCEVAANCSPYATCTFDEERKTHHCKCLPGFEGDGYNCIRPTCVLGVCWCPNGYQYINNKCERTVISDEVNQGKLFYWKSYFKRSSLTIIFYLFLWFSFLQRSQHLQSERSVRFAGHQH